MSISTADNKDKWSCKSMPLCAFMASKETLLSLSLNVRVRQKYEVKIYWSIHYSKFKRSREKLLVLIYILIIYAFVCKPISSGGRRFCLRIVGCKGFQQHSHSFR
jgi:hypothetical protein